MLKPRFVGEDVLYDYNGMNPVVAKVFGFTGIGEDECLILDSLSDEEKQTTIQHEIEENERVGAGESYWAVHVDLLKKYEDYKVWRQKAMEKLVRKSVEVIRKDGKIIISTKSPDRGGDRVNPRGGHFDNYMKNPVVMWIHDYRGQTPSAGIPIARCPSIEVTDEGIISSEPEFLPGDPFADRVKNAWERGFLKTASIGFAPLVDPKKNELGGYDYDDWELLEWSLAPIPMNAEAMRIAKAQGFEELLDKEIVTKPEETEDFIRIPVESSDKHSGHRIRTIDISAKEGISALYCGECKQILTYLFAKDHDWTMEKAREWVKEHSKKSFSQAEIKDELDFVKIILSDNTLDEENKVLAKGMVNEVARLLGCDNPIDIKAMSQKTQEAVKGALDACVKTESLIDGHHQAHLSTYMACKDLIKSEKDGLNFLLPPPQMTGEEDKSLDLEGLEILWEISKRKFGGK